MECADLTQRRRSYPGFVSHRRHELFKPTLVPFQTVDTNFSSLPIVTQTHVEIVVNSHRHESCVDDRHVHEVPLVQVTKDAGWTSRHPIFIAEHAGKPNCLRKFHRKLGHPGFTTNCRHGPFWAKSGQSRLPKESNHREIIKKNLMSVRDQLRLGGPGFVSNSESENSES